LSPEQEYVLGSAQKFGEKILESLEISKKYFFLNFFFDQNQLFKHLRSPTIRKKQVTIFSFYLKRRGLGFNGPMGRFGNFI
jgi:hypothetical protein